MLFARKLLREHERERQAWEKERAQLVATVCHLARRPLPETRPATEIVQPDFVLDGYDL